MNFEKIRNSITFRSMDLIFTVLAVIVIGGFCFLFSYGMYQKYPPIDAGAAAAWVQAICLVLTMIVMLWISRWQANEAHQSKRESIFAIAFAVNDYVLKIDEALKIDEVTADADVSTEWANNCISLYGFHDTSVIQGFRQAMQNIPYHEVGSKEKVTSLLSIYGQLNFLDASITKYLCGVENDLELKKVLEVVWNANRDIYPKTKLLQERTLLNNIKNNIKIITSEFKKLRT